MRGILKNTLLLLGGMALGSLATRRAIRYAVENRYDRVKYEEPIFGTGEDAEQVLDGLKTLISTYGNATAADLYELAGTHDFKHEMTRIGWTSVDGAEIVQTDDGYIITLPQPKPITYKEEPSWQSLPTTPTAQGRERILPHREKRKRSWKRW